MTQKIGLISFDNWHYDEKIVNALNDHGISALHIKLGQYKHKTKLVQFSNLISKIFLNKNPKLQKRQEFILEELQKNGPFDQILVINPELIDEMYHHEIKKHTKRYIAYLYDSIERFSIEHLTKGVFDKIFSFDAGDCNKYGFEKTNNYIYLAEKKAVLQPKYKALTISSFDKRFINYNKIAHFFENKGIKFKFVFVSRNIGFKKFKYNLKLFLNSKQQLKINQFSKFRSKKIPLDRMLNSYENTFCIVDIVHKNQTGLSFRVFEAMALKKKIITDNQEIKKYPFYNPNNILVVDFDDFKISTSFFDTDYQEIEKSIYENYTLNSWINKIFKLNFKNI